jgi:hypothetical protein
MSDKVLLLRVVGWLARFCLKAVRASCCRSARRAADLEVNEDDALLRISDENQSVKLNQSLSSTI